MRAKTIVLQTEYLHVAVFIDDQGATYLREVRPAEKASKPTVSKYFTDHDVPLVEVRLSDEGTSKHKGSKTLVGTYVGTRLKYKSHEFVQKADTTTLVITLADTTTNITVVSRLMAYHSNRALRATATIQNDGHEDVFVSQLTSLVIGGLTKGSDHWWHDYLLSVPNNTWFREAQWIDHDLPSIGIDDCGVCELPEGHWSSMSHYAVSNRGTFSTEGHLPMGLLKRRDGEETWIWQVENNGSWRWEIGDWKDSVYLAAGGPSEIDHGWRERLGPNESFTSVPVALCHTFGDYGQAFAELTQYRRRIAMAHVGILNDKLPIIFNGYMNCLMGDPTEEKILSLIDPVARAGAEYFVIDAGWYSDDSNWWDDVGLWEPSRKRFPLGFKELLQLLKTKGLIPGLWMEPEVVGVRSVVTRWLPDECFFQRDGKRIIEKGRYQLDYRHPAVREHMNIIIHNLVTEYGVGYFKFDYNIDVTQGTDVNCSSPGSGQLGHNRAYLEWVASLLNRYIHRGVVIENCSSGAQRMDYAMLSVHCLQSTSDQQDPYKYAAISAALPTAVAPEQSATWAYPQREWDDETNALTVVNSLLGRVMLSGRLDQLEPSQFDLIKEGMDVYRSIRGDLPRATPFWPLGLSHWHDNWIALGMVAGSGLHRYLAVWRRDGHQSVELPIPALRGRTVSCELLYPASFSAITNWDAHRGVLKVYLPSKLCARLFKLTIK